MADSNDSIQHVHANAIHEGGNYQHEETQYPIARAVFTSMSFRSQSSGSSSERWIYPEPVSCVLVDEEESVLSIRKNRWIEFLAGGITVIVIVVISLSLRGFSSPTKEPPRPIPIPIPKQTNRPTPSPTPIPTPFPTIASPPTLPTLPSLPQPSDFTPVISPVVEPTMNPTVPVDLVPPTQETSKGRRPRPTSSIPSSSSGNEDQTTAAPTIATTLSPVASTPPPVNQPPPISQDVDWVDVSPGLNITRAISVSISFSGDVIAVLNEKGIAVMKQDFNTKEWLEYGVGGISPVALTASTRTLPFDELLQNSLTTEVTLSADGERIFWYIASKVNTEESAQASLFELVRSEEDQGETLRWKQLGETKILGFSPGSRESRCFGPVVAFARERADRMVTGTRTSPLDINFGISKVHTLKANGKWSDELKDYLIHYNIKDIEDVVFDPLAGVSVAISGDGESVAVSSPDSGEDILITTSTDTGKVQVFEPATSSLRSNWKFKGQAVRGEIENNRFGIVSMSNDGNTMVVGTPNKLLSTVSGSFRVVKYINGEWSTVMDHSSESIASESALGSIDGKFGQAVTISPQGNVAAIAHPRRGQVCVYDIERKERIGMCLQEAKPDKNDQDGLLSFKIALSRDGTRLIIGIPPSETDVGYVKVYDMV